MGCCQSDNWEKMKDHLSKSLNLNTNLEESTNKKFSENSQNNVELCNTDKKVLDIKNDVDVDVDVDGDGDVDVDGDGDGDGDVDGDGDGDGDGGVSTTSNYYFYYY